MLITADMSASWWVEVARYVVYCYNRTPRKDLGGKTPYEKFYGTKPHDMPFHTWGCLSYVHIDKQKRSKRTIVRAKPAMFIGIDFSGRYLCICLRTGELLVSDSVTFVENIFPKGRHKNLMDYTPNTILKHLEQERLDVMAKAQLHEICSGPTKTNLQKDSNGPIENEVRQLKESLFPACPTKTSLQKSSNGPIENDLLPPIKPRKNTENDGEAQENSSDTDVYSNTDEEDNDKDETENDNEEVENEIESETEKENEDEQKQPEVYNDNKTHDEIPKLETMEEVFKEVSKDNPCEHRNNYEHDKITNDHETQKPEPRRSTRIKNLTDHPSIKIMEHLSQTPKKERKKYLRKHRKDLEAIANQIIQEQQQPNKIIPPSVKAAMEGSEWPRWNEAIQKEINALYRTNAIEEVNTLPFGVKAIQCRWVFKIKPANAQEPEIYKARLVPVAKGFTQKLGIDYTDTFAAVAKMTSLRILIALAAKNNSRLTKLDVSNAFLESDIDKEVYIKAPEGFPPNTFFKLRKALYGLKQSPRLFQKTLTAELNKMGFTPMQTDNCIFRHHTSNTRMLVVVDDIIIEGTDEEMRTKIIQRMEDRFKIKAFDKVEHFIGLQVEHTESYIKLHQTTYIQTLLERFNMIDCKTVPTPAVDSPQGSDELLPPGNNYRQLVGSLIYLMATRPDIFAQQSPTSQGS